MSFRTLLVPVDFGEATQAATSMAIELARQFDAEIILVHAYDLSPFIYAGAPLGGPLIDPGAIRQLAEEAMTPVARDVGHAWPRTASVVRAGVPWSAILETAAEREADLIVMGTHGRRGLARALLGSVAEKVVRLSPIPVLTIRPATAATAAAAIAAE